MPPEVKTIRIDRVVFQQTLEKKLADLPPLPAVVTRIMQTINNPTTSAEELSRLISLDQGLASKILRIVNSAYYGFPKRISTITHAVVILGFNTVRNLVLGVSAFGMLPQKGTSSGLNRAKFWEHSVAVAIMSSAITKKRNPQTRSAMEEAFIVGLLHDLGKLFLDCYFPVQFAVCVAFAGRENISQVEAEKRVLDIDHTIVGRKIAEHWNFPPMLTNAIGAHHAPDPATEHFDMAAVILVADWMVWQAGVPSTEGVCAPELPQAIDDWLMFSEQDFADVRADWEAQYHAAKDLLRLVSG
jgi:putative nucleotidyltransferase with HDIG domain